MDDAMDLRQLEYFAAVARQRHFRRAAEDLYVTQSAVSQQIKRLEAELGVALLRRTAGNPPVELTAAGEELLARAEAILATVAETRAAMDAHAGALRGGVRVAATTGDAIRLAAGAPAPRAPARRAQLSAASSSRTRRARGRAPTSRRTSRPSRNSRNVGIDSTP
jgi:DNA-binding transcriptional LysR family regulator